jgi:hypothetical protein
VVKWTYVCQTDIFWEPSDVWKEIGLSENMSKNKLHIEVWGFKSFNRK